MAETAVEENLTEFILPIAFILRIIRYYQRIYANLNNVEINVTLIYTIY